MLTHNVVEQPPGRLLVVIAYVGTTRARVDHFAHLLGLWPGYAIAWFVAVGFGLPSLVLLLFSVRWARRLRWYAIASGLPQLALTVCWMGRSPFVPHWWTPEMLGLFIGPPVLLGLLAIVAARWSSRRRADDSGRRSR